MQILHMEKRRKDHVQERRDEVRLADNNGTAICFVQSVRETWSLTVREEFSFCNPILFAISTNTFSRLCENVYSGM
jgi:hypothetical protein